MKGFQIGLRSRKMQKKLKPENIFAKINNMEFKKWDENIPSWKI